MPTDFAPPIKVTGDVQGLPLGSQIVTALQGRKVSGVPPVAAQALMWDSSSHQWLPTSPPGTAIAYNIITATVNVTGLASSTATTIVTSTSKTYDGTQVIVEFFSPEVTTPSAAAGNNTNIGLFESGSLIAQLAGLNTTAAATQGVPVLARFLFSPSAGSHAYTIGAWVSNTTGTPRVFAGTGSAGANVPAYIRITKS